MVANDLTLFLGPKNIFPWQTLESPKSKVANGRNFFQSNLNSCSVLSQIKMANHGPVYGMLPCYCIRPLFKVMYAK